MITDPEWNIISKKAFPDKSAKAPAFLWTRILARIEAEETRRGASWWMQWRWMMRLTFTIGLFAVMGSYYLFDQAVPPLDTALTGISAQHNAITLASLSDTGPDETPDLIVEASL